MNDINENTLKERINRILRERNLDGKRLAEMTGLTAGTISHWRTGRIKTISTESALKIAEALHLPPTWHLVHDFDLSKRPANADAPYSLYMQDESENVSIIEYNADGELSAKPDGLTLCLSRQYVSERGVDADNLAIFRVNDDSMLPVIRPDDYVIVDRSDTGGFNVNSVYLLKIKTEVKDDNLFLLRRIIKRISGYALQSDNKAYSAEEVSFKVFEEFITVIGRVIDRFGPV